jgi:hypothetical protein
MQLTCSVYKLQVNYTLQATSTAKCRLYIAGLTVQSQNCNLLHHIPKPSTTVTTTDVNYHLCVWCCSFLKTFNPGLTFFGTILMNRCGKTISWRTSDASFISIVEIWFVQGPQKLNGGSGKALHLGMIDWGFTVLYVRLEDVDMPFAYGRDV